MGRKRRYGTISYAMLRNQIILGVLGALALTAGAAASEDNGLTFFTNLVAGVEYDSNVAVLEVDQSSGEEDYAAVFEGTIGLRKAFTSDVELEGSYDFYQSLQEEFSDFNVQTHRATVDLSRKIGDVRIGANYYYVYAELAGADLLDIQQGSVYGETLVGERGYLRASYAYLSKTYPDSPSRDGEAHEISLDGYYFFNAVKSFVTLGYKFTDEKTQAQQFSYSGHRVKAALNHKANLVGRLVEFETGAAYETRDYEGPTPSIGVREDERFLLEASIEVPLSERFSVELAYEHNILNSNLPTVDFTENVAALRLGYRY